MKFGLSSNIPQLIPCRVTNNDCNELYGDFTQFAYYLNPTPIDRNIEFDPKQNLLQGLQSFEQVRQP